MVRGYHIEGMTPILNQFIDEFEWRQTRFPKSKKKRIRKKWNKNKSNWSRVEIPKMFKQGRCLVCGPKAYEILTKNLNNHETNRSENKTT